MKNNKWKSYLGWIILTQAVGALSGWLTRGGSEFYRTQVEKPPLSPPSIVFPIVWVILFFLMGIGIARVQNKPLSSERALSLRVFLVQLAFNFCWSIIFFNFRAYGVALIWLVVLWVLILWMIHSFRKVDPTAAWLQLPYLLWVTFAAYLNFGVWMLNR